MFNDTDTFGHPTMWFRPPAWHLFIDSGEPVYFGTFAPES